MGILFIISTQIVFDVDRFKPGFHKACSVIDLSEYNVVSAKDCCRALKSLLSWCRLRSSTAH